MNRKEIIRMAREAGGADIESNGYTSWVGTQTTEFLERFAALIAAASKAEEREAIAQIIEDAPPLVDYAINERGGCLFCGFTPKLASEFIRARGKTK